MNRLNNLYEQFQKIPSIEDYFQIKGYTFNVSRIDETTFHFNSSTIAPNLELKIPKELIDYIQSYLIEKLSIEIKYPRNYPFKCPRFSLISGSDNSGLRVLNYAYDRDWSPAIIFEKDILNLIQHIV
jgi:hypothetical protein